MFLLTRTSEKNCPSKQLAQLGVQAALSTAVKLRANKENLDVARTLISTQLGLKKNSHGFINTEKRHEKDDKVYANKTKWPIENICNFKQNTCGS